MPSRMLTVSSRPGSSTRTDWKRRSRAASFSKYFRYSSMVVAPMHWISPRESEGLSMLEASMLPSAPPAPMMVWSSSMKRMTLPAAWISFMMRLRRSSNSPRYLVPATTDARSRARMRLRASSGGASPRAKRCARPSTMAVLPTPGSPTRTGLFLVRRERMRTTRPISRSRSKTGSSRPSRARAVRSRACSSRRGVRSPAGALAGRAAFSRRGSLFSESWRSCAADLRLSTDTPRPARKRWKEEPSSLAAATTKCSVPI